MAQQAKTQAGWEGAVPRGAERHGGVGRPAALSEPDRLPDSSDAASPMRNTTTAIVLVWHGN